MTIMDDPVRPSAAIEVFRPELLTGLNLSGFEDRDYRRLLQAMHILRRSKSPTFKPILPLLLSLKGDPFTLQDHFPFEPFYRRRVARKTLFKTGRQVAKCCRIIATQCILLANGRRVPGHQLQVGDRVLAMDEQHRITSAKVLDVITIPDKPVLRVTLRTGVVLEIAETHPLYTPAGWTRGDELHVGDRVCVARCGGQFENRKVPPGRIAATVRAIGDAANDPAQRIPDWVFGLGREDTIRLIDRLWARNGLCRANAAGQPAIVYRTVSRPLALDLKALLLKFGIPCTVQACFGAHILRPKTQDGVCRFLETFPIGRPWRATVSKRKPPANDVLWDEIVAIEPQGVQPCWDIEVESYHNYLVEGVVSHNSTNLAARGIVQSISASWFSTLFIAPQYEQIRRFSQNYVRPFLEISPARALFTGGGNTNSVLQRNFSNNSKMIFSFAFLSADRIRGISADKLSIDESACGTSTYVKTSQGFRRLIDVFPGDYVASYTKHGVICWDRVVANNYHGYRRCFRVTLNNGRAITLTAESWLATPKDWQRVSSLINDAAASVDLGHPARGRVLSAAGQGEPALSRAARLETARIQLSQIPDIVQVRQHTAAEAEECRLRGMVERLGHAELSGIYLLHEPLLSTGQRWPGDQDGDAGLAQRDHSGGTGVVGGRRRQPQSGRLFDDAAYRRVHGSGGEHDLRVVAGEICSREQCKAYSQPLSELRLLLAHPLHRGGHQADDRADFPTHASLHAVQDYALAAARDRDMLLLRTGVHAARDASQAAEHRGEEQPEALLSETRVSPEKAPTAVTSVDGQAREAGTEERASTGTVLGERRGVPRAQPGDCRGLPPAAPRPGDRKQTQVQGEAAGVTEGADLGVPAVPLEGAAGRAGYARAVLREVPGDRDEGDETGTSGETRRGQTGSKDDTARGLPELREGISGAEYSRAPAAVLLTGLPAPVYQPTESGEVSLEAVAVARIEYVGYRHVYDLETDQHNAFLANGIALHNCQDIDKDLLPVVKEVLSGSKTGGIEEYAGTPKGLENTIEDLWQDSSQAEWIIPCTHCGRWNVPALNRDLDAMIGPLRDDISPERPAIVCADCRKPLYPQLGRWVHDFADRRWKFAGYHIPQIIMPMHCGNPEKWADLLGKRAGKANTPINVFYNEVCGESYDTGSRLITLTELRRAACLPWPNEAPAAKEHMHEYLFTVLAADWGGGGEDGVSYTVLAALGMLPSGEIHVIWGKRSLTPHNHEQEANMVVEAINYFGCQEMAHDYTGAGSLRETLINQAGYPNDHILPIAYTRAASSLRVLTYKPPTKLNPRGYFQADKTRSLLLTCHQIKHGGVKFFQDDYENADSQGLLRDFLALVDEKADSRIGKDVYTITRDPSRADDFAQAVNIGCCALWHMSGHWPDLRPVERYRITEETLARLHPPDYNAVIDIP